MARATFEYGALNELAAEFVQMDDALKAEIKATAQTIGRNLQTNTEAMLWAHKTKEPKHGTYFADDVKMSVSVNEKRASAKVNGGKTTGRLWWTVDNGHVAKNGKFVPGIHFTDDAYSLTDVEGPVDQMIQRVLNNG